MGFPPRSAFHSARLRRVTFALVAATAAIAACLDTESYVFTARRYDPAGSCLEPYAPVEVVDGPGAAATCPETCFTVGTDVFVTTMCPPLPATATELPADAEACVAARAVSATTCGASSEERGQTDGASPAEASTEGGSAPNLDAATPDGGDGA